MLEEALDYASRGWPVFPLRPAAKVPATKRGLHAATTDADTLTAWWEHNPDMNIGIATGPAGLCVIDLDVKPAQGVDGIARWWELLEDAGAEHPPTLCSVTPSGGWHLFFRLDPGWCIRNSASKLAPGIDVRAQGGYVLAPPSVTPAGVYELDYIWCTDVLDAPAWLIDRLIAKPPRRVEHIAPAAGDGTPYGMAALERELGRLAVAADGTRNQELNRAAFSLGRLVAGGQLDPAATVDRLLVVASRIGLPGPEADATISSGLASGMQSPRTPAR